MQRHFKTNSAMSLFYWLEFKYRLLVADGEEDMYSWILARPAYFVGARVDKVVPTKTSSMCAKFEPIPLQLIKYKSNHGGARWRI